MSLPESIPAVSESTVLDEKDLKVATDATHVENIALDDCPDGGLRAWLVVLGVCLSCVIIGRSFCSSLCCTGVLRLVRHSRSCQRMGCEHDCESW